MKYKEKIGYCLDTCHLFAAGYDFRTEQSYSYLEYQLSTILGIDNIYAIHVNDSKKDLGSRIDRHEHIGKGFIGKEGFRFFLNDKDFFNIPFILETPKENNMDEKNLKILRELIAENFEL
jgi:deoxyribonuclease-4